jgi:rhamnopyranosyl-N-acetylglucosaminyl-diphospho-decaprenol beta-1,3/1,4-galactofuranosyltransferase
LTAAAALPHGSVVAVVVTRHRREQLVDSLAAMAKQTHPIAHLIVVDNGPDEPAREVVEACGIPATWLPSWRNLGGAGGFALGMLHALALGADWVWLGDDDGRAADETVLATLLDLAQRRMLAAVSPVVIAAFFNGALFRAGALEMIGVPDLRLFVRGDEVELHRRMVRSKLPFGTSLAALYLHPRGTDDLKPMLGGRLHAQHPDDAAKRYYTYRNRGYLVSKPGMRRVGLLELPRFAWFFLVTRHDPKGFAEWVRLLRQGRAERFDRL